jgi:predicted nucleic acid-binding protein
MAVLVDTPVWSVVFRKQFSTLRPDELAAFREFDSLVPAGRPALVGPVRQEVLSGLKSRQHFDDLRERLSVFPDEPMAVQDYEVAARMSYDCRAAGVIGSLTDMLICAISARNEMTILTLDKDFERYARVLHVRLHPVPPGA